VNHGEQWPDCMACLERRIAEVLDSAETENIIGGLEQGEIMLLSRLLAARIVKRDAA
jgi:hypothetical protein